MLSSSYNNCVAFLTSLNEVTVHFCHPDKVSSLINIRNSCSLRRKYIFQNKPPDVVSIIIEMEPSFLGVGPYHLAVGMNNRIWYYKINMSDPTKLSASLFGDREYLGNVKNVCINGEFIAVLFEGRLQIHTVSVYKPNTFRSIISLYELFCNRLKIN